eukprot:TRINITY_DN8027_c0_g1_i1.p1 TRINITY_DN8027_c0_g1~~TRINITY_DN8027_c0_g1_i1.p1  ORF type:complete len:251 (+),score=42.08 TRINITY_DN8027_c0_g1_i1:116-868(+)
MKIGVLHTENFPAWKNLGEIHQIAFGQSTDTWVVFEVFCGQYPTDDEFATFDGFVITGSHSASYDSEEWILQLISWLQKHYSIDVMGSSPKIVGICFGHQILAHALGGQASQSPHREFDIGAVTVHVNDDFVKLIATAAETDTLVNGFLQTRQYTVLESHGDCVTKLPPTATLLAFSDRTTVQAFVIQNRVLGIQSHPELTADHLSQSIIPSLLKRGRIDQARADAALKSLPTAVDSIPLRRVVRAFLSG